jgi:hypothetical protein
VSILWTTIEESEHDGDEEPASEKALGSSADTWLRMQMNYDLAQIRKRASSIDVKRFARKVA